MRTAFVALLTVLLVGDLRAQATPGAPQQPPSQSTAASSQAGKWELEAHGGWLLNINQSRGQKALPTTGSIVGGQISVTSFFFGEGARFLNPTLTPLDAVLRAPAFEWQPQVLTVGVRLDRAVRRRFTADISVDYNRATLSVMDAALRGIETSRASVAAALQQLLANRPVTSVVSAVTTVNDSPAGSQLAATGSVLLNLRGAGKAIPYVTGGGGVVFNMVDPASVNVTGRYALGSPAQIFGVDSVTVKYSPTAREFMGIVGGGLKYYATPRWGIRFDGRVHLYPNKMANIVDATPVVTLRSTGSPFPVINIGMLQFSSTAPLTGAPITQFSTFTGAGLRAQTSAAAGVFWRF